jgi:GPI mannosyltransferase 1 subunit M
MSTSSAMAKPWSLLYRVLNQHAVLVGLWIRFVIAYVAPLLLDDGRLVPGVAYTDIDYHVFLDAAHHVQQGHSPYDRHTYRYTPFLAYLLSKLPYMRMSARYVFCLADTACGAILLRLRREQRRRNEDDDSCSNNSHLSDAWWWLYNPFAINICTRGSAEALVLLPVLVTVYLLQSLPLIEFYGSSSSSSSGSTNSGAATKVPPPRMLPGLLITVVGAGMWHGLAIHAKLYPIIYTLSYAAFLAPPPSPQSRTNAALSDRNAAPNNRSATKSLDVRVLWGWLERLLTPLPVLFGAVSLLTFAALTYGAYAFYGPTSLQEGLLYHVGRVDHRHNYSIFWYPIYLALAGISAETTGEPIQSGLLSGWISPSAFLQITSRALFVPQALLLAYVSLGVAPRRLVLAMFVQTFLFVALNKVITAQYFTWYLVLLPLCTSEFHKGWNRSPRTRRRLQASIALFVASILTWLGCAYCLEMQGMPVHTHVWAASLLFFVASVNLLGALLAACGSDDDDGEVNPTNDLRVNKAHSKID